jgi:hypothetical protein
LLLQSTCYGQTGLIAPSIDLFMDKPDLLLLQSVLFMDKLTLLLLQSVLFKDKLTLLLLQSTLFKDKLALLLLQSTLFKDDWVCCSYNGRNYFLDSSICIILKSLAMSLNVGVALATPTQSIRTKPLSFLLATKASTDLQNNYRHSQ